MNKIDIEGLLKKAGVEHRKHIEISGIGDRGKETIQIKKNDAGLYEYTINYTTFRASEKGTLSSENLLHAAISIIGEREYRVVRVLSSAADKKISQSKQKTKGLRM